MEFTKLRALSIRCEKCSAERSIDEKDFEKHIITCQNQQCNNEFNVFEGIKNSLKNFQETIMPNVFLANSISHEIIDVKIGYEAFINLPSNIQKIYKLDVQPMGNFLAGVVEINKSGFKILTSLLKDSDKNLIGEYGKIFVMISAKTDNYNIPWMEMLQYAFELFRNEEYLTCILFAEIAFEIYIDTTLSEGYRSIGLDEDTISRFLTASELPAKVNPLMNNLYKIKLSNSTSWKNWEKKVLKWRNEIAHGSKTNATKNEAKLTYETVVDSIFYFMEGTVKSN